MADWKPIAELPPDGELVMTKCDGDGRGLRNVQMLRRRKNLFFHPDDSMYVYYCPTHWRPLTEEERDIYIVDENAKAVRAYWSTVGRLKKDSDAAVASGR